MAKDKKNEDKGNKLSALEIVKNKIKKDMGDIITTMDKKSPFIPTISSGSLKLDIALGRGGFAFGRIYEVFGRSMGGKTTLTISALAQAQKKGLTGCFVDAEHAADPELFKGMGVNLEDLLLIEGFEGEENLEALELLIKTGDIDIAVVDSVSALIPKAEADEEIDKNNIGLLARLMSKATRRFAPICAKTNTLLIFINQVRTDIRTFGAGGGGDKTTGGNALTFYSTGRLAVGPVYKGNLLHYKDGEKEGEVYGHKMSIEIKKNKLSAPFKTCEVDLIYGHGFDSVKEIIDVGSSFGIIDKSGNWYKFNGDNIGNGIDNTKQFLLENEDVFDEVKGKIFDMLNLREYYERDIKSCLRKTD